MVQMVGAREIVVQMANTKGIVVRVLCYQEIVAREPRFLEIVAGAALSEKAYGKGQIYFHETLARDDANAHLHIDLSYLHVAYS